MNNELVQINKNLGVITDENGSAKIIKIDDDNKLEEILLRENDLEAIKYSLKEMTERLTHLKSYKSFKRVESLGILTGIFVIKLISPGNFASLLSSIVFAKILLTVIKACSFGNPITLRLRVKMLEDDINNLETTIPELEQELAYLKSEAKFQEISSIPEQYSNLNTTVSKQESDEDFTKKQENVDDSKVDNAKPSDNDVSLNKSDSNIETPLEFAARQENVKPEFEEEINKVEVTRVLKLVPSNKEKMTKGR